MISSGRIFLSVLIIFSFFYGPIYASAQFDGGDGGDGTVTDLTEPPGSGTDTANDGCDQDPDSAACRAGSSNETTCEQQGGVWDLNDGTCNTSSGVNSVSISGNLERMLGSYSSALAGCAGGSNSSSNFITNSVNSVLGSATGGLTNAATGAIRGAANSAGIPSAITNTAITAGTRAVSSAVNTGINGARDAILSGASGLLTSFTGGAQDLISSAAMQFGSQGLMDVGNFIGSIGSDGLSSLAGSLTGGIPGVGMVMSMFGGGSEVPTADQQVRTKTSSLERKQVCSDVLASATGRQILARINKDVLKWANAGFDGYPLFGNGVNQYQQQAVRTAQSSFLDTLSRSNSPINRKVAQDLARNESAKNAFESDPYATIASEPDPPTCNDYSLSCFRLLSEWNPMTIQQRKASQLAQIKEMRLNQAKEQQVNGFNPDMTCDDPGWRRGQSMDNCKNPRVKTPASIVERLVTDVAGSPQKLAAEASQKGEDAAASVYDWYSEKLTENGYTIDPRAADSLLNDYSDASAQSLRESIEMVVEGLQTNYIVPLEQAITLITGIVGKINDLNTCYDGLPHKTDSMTGQLWPEVQTIKGHVEYYTGAQNGTPRLSTYTSAQSGHADALLAASPLIPAFEALKDSITDSMSGEDLMGVQQQFTDLTSPRQNGYPSTEDISLISQEISAMTHEYDALSGYVRDCNTENTREQALGTSRNTP